LTGQSSNPRAIGIAETLPSSRGRWLLDRPVKPDDDSLMRCRPSNGTKFSPKIRFRYIWISWRFANMLPAPCLWARYTAMISEGDL
jgi:hypothetical protein